jgi:hypothetical protein
MLTQSGHSQADSREFLVYTDQHGREWEGWGDVKAKLHPTTTLKPLFDAPWLPDQRLMTFSQRKPGEFVINYEAILAEGARAHEARRDLVLQVADHFNVPGFDPDTDQPTAQMRRELGEGPLPLDPIVAALQGNKYVLGLRPFDAKRPGDVKLKAALAHYAVKPRVALEPEFAEDYTDEKPKNRGGRPTNAEREARLAAAAVEG